MRNLKRALSLAVASVMLFGMMVVGSSAASYPDVDAADNLEAIEVLKMVGIMEGDESGKFNPDKMVTRNEMAVVMVNLLGLTPGGSCPFTDVPSWAQPYVAACYNNDIIAGVSATEFNGDANVTAVQSGLMVMKALGYFGYQGEFYDSWKLSVVKQANKIDLYRGVSAYTDQDMTRNDVAQMVLNALECTVKVVREVGGINVEGNGISVIEKPSYTYENAAENRDDWDYTGTKADGLMQLCEKLYGKDLKKNSNAVSDDYDRPATEWTYHSKSVKCPDEPELTYTEEVKAKTIYTDLNKGSFDSASKPAADKYVRYVDGSLTPLTDDDGAEVSIAKNADEKFGGQGVLTEVYYSSQTDSVTIVEINTYLAKVTKVADNDDDYTVTVSYRYDSSVKPNGATKVDKDIDTTEEFAKDDMVLVTLYEGNASGEYELGSIAKAETAAGKVTAVKNDSSNKYKSYIKLDGEQYDKAAKFYNISESKTLLPSVDSKVDIYLDTYGNVIGSDGQSVPDDYLYVIDCMDALGGVQAKVLFTDGTIATIDITKYDPDPDVADDELEDGDIESGAGKQINKGMVFAYSEDDGEYSVTKLEATTTAEEDKYDTFTTNAKTTGTNNYYVITRGNSNITEGDVTATSPLKTGNFENKVTTDNATVFVDKENEVAYTGYKAVPGMEGVSLIAIYGKDEVAEVIFITEGSDSNVDNEFFFAKNSDHDESKEGNNTYRAYLETYVNGEKETITTKGMGYSAVKAGELYEIKKADSSGNVTGLNTIVSQSDTMVGSSVTKTDVDNGNADMAANTRATYAKRNTLVVGSQSDKVAGGKDEFVYNDDTVFMIADLKVNKSGEYEVDSVYSGSVSDIVVESSTGSDTNASAVFIITVDDKTDVTPLAELVLVVTPPQP